MAILVGLKVGHDNDVDDIRAKERREYIQIQMAKLLLRQLKPFTKTWAQPGPEPNNFKVKPKLNKKMNIRFGKEALELADRVLMEPGGRKWMSMYLGKPWRDRRNSILALIRRPGRSFIDMR